MIDSLTSLDPTFGVLSKPDMALPSDVETFKQLMAPSHQVEGAVKAFINNAENRIERGELQVSSKLKEFNYKDNVISLVGAMHESSMNSVSIQLTGKIGTKISENFESLIKQQ